MTGNWRFQEEIDVWTKTIEALGNLLVIRKHYNIMRIEQTNNAINIILILSSRIQCVSIDVAYKTCYSIFIYFYI